MQAFYMVAEQGLPELLSGLLQPNQESIGFYENSANDFVFITTDGLYLIDEHNCSFISFEAIEKVVLPNEQKNEASTLEVRLKDGTSKSISIEHGNGRFRDVFEFVRFIDRVLTN